MDLDRLRRTQTDQMKPAVIVVDMLRDTLEGDHSYAIKPFALEIVPAINRLTEAARSRSAPVIFAMDSFLRGDFIFKRER